MVRSNFITLSQMKAITESILFSTGYSLQWNGVIEPVPIEDIIGRLLEGSYFQPGIRSNGMG
jgi:hypothetical protein